MTCEARRAPDESTPPDSLNSLPDCGTNEESYEISIVREN
jgi:hypothetical protein